MTTQYNDPNMTMNRHDTAYKQIDGNFNPFNKSSVNLKSDDNDKNEWIDDVDVGNIYTIEKEGQNYETDQFDNVSAMDNEGTWTSTILKPLEEQILSQKFTQLSTTTADEQPTMMKDLEDEINKIPHYLTKRNKLFLQVLHQALSNISIATSNKNDTKNHIEALRHIAILIYKIIFIQIYQTLWRTYLKSGMGQLINQSQDRFIYSVKMEIWPKEIKTMIQSITMKKTIENEVCMAFVNNSLHQLDKQLKQSEVELKIQATIFNGYTLTIPQTIKAYIEQNLSCLRTEIEHKIQLVHYDFHIRALKLEYLQHKPNEYREQLMAQACQSKYNQETTEQEYHLFKQKITYYNSPSQSFDSSSIAYSLLNASLEDQEIRQEFFQRYKAITEQCRATLFAIYMESAEDQREEYKKKYEANVEKIFSSQHSLNDKEKLSPIMIHLINERCTKISERIKCIYKFKAQSFFFKTLIAVL